MSLNMPSSFDVNWQPHSWRSFWIICFSVSSDNVCKFGYKRMKGKGLLLNSEDVLQDGFCNIARIHLFRTKILKEMMKKDLKMKKRYLNITIALLRISSISLSLRPLIPFLSFSSMKRERYSGLFEFKLMKCSKSEVIICLKTRSSRNDSVKKRLYFSWILVSARTCNIIILWDLVKLECNRRRIFWRFLRRLIFLRLLGYQRRPDWK